MSPHQPAPREGGGYLNPSGVAVVLCSTSWHLRSTRFLPREKHVHLPFGETSVILGDSRLSVGAILLFLPGGLRGPDWVVSETGPGPLSATVALKLPCPLSGSWLSHTLSGDNDARFAEYLFDASSIAGLPMKQNTTLCLFHTHLISKVPYLSKHPQSKYPLLI